MKVHTCSFSDFKGSDLPNGVSIALYAPKWFAGPSIKDLHPLGEAFVPTPEMLKLYKSNPSPRSWSIYVRNFSQNMYPIFLSNGIQYTGIPMSSVLAEAFTAILTSQGWDEITLLCWEGEKNPRCHRKLIIDWLAYDMRGKRR